MDINRDHRSLRKRLLLLAVSSACTLLVAHAQEALSAPSATGHAPAAEAPIADQPSDSARPAVAFPSAAEHATAALTHRIIPAPNGSFGYDILSDGRLLIHQTNLPGRPGNEGCRTREQAERLAQLVITKIQRGEMPPTVTQEELKTLEIP